MDGSSIKMVAGTVGKCCCAFVGRVDTTLSPNAMRDGCGMNAGLKRVAPWYCGRDKTMRSGTTAELSN